MYMAAVIGAGPIGSVCAKKIQENGWNTVLLEEHPKSGIPVNCTGIISSSGVKERGILKQTEEATLNKVKGAQIFSPHHEMIEVKRNNTVAHIIDRAKFDQILAQEAVDAGVEFRTNTKMIDIRNETIFFEYQGGRGGLLKSKIIIGADGVNSRTRKIAGIETGIENYVHAYQVVAKGEFNPDYVQVFFGDNSKDFFAWIVPESETRARVGLASTSGNVRKDFNFFIQEKNINGALCERCSSLIPIGRPFRKTVFDNLMLIGDSAFQTKATTGGGILSGIHCAELAAETIHEHYKDKAPLENYEKKCSEINKELELHWKLRKYMNSLNEEKMDKLFQKMNKSKMSEFLNEHGDMDKPSKFIGKIMLKPAMWRMFPDALKFLRA